MSAAAGPTNPRTILHVDMDAFFVAVEVRRDPSLAGKPLIVGGAGERGVVASCSYEARAFGIHSAMPSVRARRLCPDAIFLHGNYDLYTEASHELHEVLRAFTPLVEGISIDEAFLDVTGAQRLFGDGEAIAHQLRARVRNDLALSCSVGVAPVKMLAKLASEAAKPKASLQGTVEGAGVFVVRPGEELAFLHPLPVESLWGVGPATAKRLHAFGVVTVADLAALPLETLIGALGRAAGRHLHDLAWARDPRAVEPSREVKSISHEQTYAHDLVERDELSREAVRMADAVASRLREAGVAGRTVTVKVRFHDFATITRSHTCDQPVDEGPVIARVARSLLDQVDSTNGVRLLGVAVSGLTPARQLSFDEQGWSATAAAVQEVRGRFGADAVGPAALVGDSGLRVKKRGEQQWGPASGRGAE